MRRAPSVVLATLLTLGAAAPSHAQADGLRIRATRRDTIKASATVTAAFAVSSLCPDSVQVMPHIETPKDWTVLMGAVTFQVRPRSTEILMLSLVVPARAAAGLYPIRVWVTTSSETKGTMDSVMVVVPQRRALEVGVVERPSFVVSGKGYDVGFLVRNRGNAASAVHLGARSSRGVSVVSTPDIQLAPDESRVVRVSVRTPAGLESATDDVLEIAATQPGDEATRAEASSRVTLVPEPSRKIEEYLRVPTRVNVRAASSDGVSPFEIMGLGTVRDGSPTEIEFLLRGRTGAYSAFGERDEYRAQLTTPNWRARIGDQLFMLSSLTGGAQPGFGVGADMSRGIMSFGGFGQQFRRAQEKGSESGAFVGVRPISGANVAVNVVDRAGGLLDGRVGSATASLDRDSYNADVELAKSQSGPAHGLARSARLSGSSSGFSYDVGHLYADTAFSGSQRGSEHNYFTTSARTFEMVSLALAGSRHRTDLSRSTGVPYQERLDVGTLAGTLFNRYTLELGSVMRGTTIQGNTRTGRQHSARARADQDLAFGLLSLEAEAGRTDDQDVAPRVYTDFSIGARHTFQRGAVALWGERYSGGSLTKGADGTMTLGGDASIRVSRTTNFTLMGYSTRLRTADAEWHVQMDALVSYLLPNGNSVGLRARFVGGGNLPSTDRSVGYLEYGMPLRLPVSRLRTPGRVYGRVVDAVTGHGVPGALVRLGPQVAITDKQGQVAFGGVPAGEHRVSMSQETSFADAVFVGDPTLMVDSTKTQPTTFQLAIARSARLEIGVRRFSTVRTGVAGAPDSLADAGPLTNATLMLAGERDTLYRTTSDDGKVSFTDIPPGRWTITIRGDAPAFHRFDPDRLELTLAPGEAKALTFRLVPRRREVQIIGEGQELRPTAADPKTTTPSKVKAVKPNEQIKHDH